MERRARTPNEQAAWEAWMFETHSREELARWVSSLRIFRYCRAVGGHSGRDADELRAAFATPTRVEAERVLAVLGTSLQHLPPDAPAPVPGRPYTGEQWRAFPSRIDAFGDVRQPGHLDVAGTRAFAWVAGGRLELTVGDPARPWDVTDVAIAGARWIEPLLAPVADLVIDPPWDDEYCVSPSTWPALFRSGHAAPPPS